MLSLGDALARLEGVRRSGTGFVARCPAHPDHNPSLSIREGEGGRVLLKCFAGCDYRAIVDALGIEPGRAPAAQPTMTKPAGDDNTARIEAARKVWREARGPRGTIVQDYLFGRGWTGEMPGALCVGADPTELARKGIGLLIPAALRFHPRLKHPSGVYLPAMVAAIEVRDGEIGGVHRTFLKPDGMGKAEVEPSKMALGRTKGCSVRLSAGAPELVICEGIETGLAILQATGRHVWCALGTANLGQVELPAFVRAVIIAADNDEPGLKAAHAAAESYRARGYQVRIVSPGSDGADFNDAVRRRHGPRRD